MGGSLGYLTHGISATQGKQNLWFLYDCNGKGQKEVDLSCNKRNVMLVHITQNYSKHQKWLQLYFCTHLHWQEFNRTVSLYATFCKTITSWGVRAPILNVKMHSSSTDVRNNTRSASKILYKKILVFIHFYFSKFIFYESVLIAQVCRVHWWKKAEDTQWSDPAELYLSTSHFPTYIITPLYKRRYFFFRASTYKCQVFVSG